MSRLRGSRILQLADRRGRATPAGPCDGLGAEIWRAALHHVGCRLYRGLSNSGSARRRRRSQGRHPRFGGRQQIGL